MGSFLDSLPEFDWELFRLTLQANDLPPVCEECKLDWRQYRRRVQTEVNDWSEIVHEEPVYVVMTLECPRGHHHRWVTYPDGKPMPTVTAMHILQREEEREAEENER